MNHNVYIPISPIKNLYNSADAMIFNHELLQIEHLYQYKSFNNKNILPKDIFYSKIHEHCLRYQNDCNELVFKFKNSNEYNYYNDLIKSFETKANYPKITLIDYSYLDQIATDDEIKMFNEMKTNLIDLDKNVNLQKSYIKAKEIYLNSLKDN